MTNGTLNITRRQDQGVTITVPASDSETVIGVKSTLKSIARLSITAPKSTKILRDEQISREKKERQDG